MADEAVDATDPAVNAVAEALKDKTLEAKWEPLDFPEERKKALKETFDAKAGSEGRLPIKEVHKMLFTDTERLEYGFDNFDEDLQARCPQQAASASRLMTCHSAWYTGNMRGVQGHDVLDRCMRSIDRPRLW